MDLNDINKTRGSSINPAIIRTLRPPTDGLNRYNMKKYIIVYCGQKGIAGTKEEAIQLIESFRNYGKKDGELLVVNDNLSKGLENLFSDGVIKSFKTINCGCKAIMIYEALADTIEEHQRIYDERCENEKKERIAASNARKEALLKEFKEIKRGWYGVNLEINCLDIRSSRRYTKSFSGNILADSKMEAYNKSLAQMDYFCSSRDFIFESAAEWNSSNTEIEFLGMRTDNGYSIDAWNEFSRTEEYRLNN